VIRNVDRRIPVYVPQEKGEGTLRSFDVDQSRLRSDFRIGAVDEAFQPSSGSVPDAVGVPVDPDIPFYGFDPGDFPVRSRNASRSGSPFPFDGKGAGRFIFGL